MVAGTACVRDLRIGVILARRLSTFVSYLTIPSIAALPLEAHPFTMLTSYSADSSDVTFLLEARDGFTRRLLQAAHGARGLDNVAAYVDGPYGASC